MRTDSTLRGTGPRRRAPTLFICAVAGLALVVVVGLQAPAVSEGLRWTWPSRSPDPMSMEIEPFDWGFMDAGGSGERKPWPLGVLAWILAILVGAGILYRGIRWLRRMIRPSPALTVVGMGAVGSVPGEPDAQVVLSGLAAALEILTSERDPGNAVVQAWQGLEDAAAAAGIDRRPAETTSEFTARILYHSRNSAVPIDMLQSLYQRVRFGDHYPDADEIVSARESLTALVSLWQIDLADRRPTRRAR